MEGAGILIDYHLVFIAMTFAMFILEIMILFFSEHTLEKLVGNIILSGFNANICWICCLSFYGLNIPGFDSEGNLVNNLTVDMTMLSGIFLGLFLVNVGIIIYTHISLMRLKLKLNQKITP